MQQSMKKSALGYKYNKINLRKAKNELKNGEICAHSEFKTHY